jgi:small nuclear ribonucleoprotein (snRNP)-like protein
MVIDIPCVNNGTQIIYKNTLYPINSFEIRTCKNIFSQNGFASFKFNDNIPFRVLKKCHSDNILLELSFGKHINGVLCGLDPNTINGSFDDFFKVIVHTHNYLDNQVDNKLYNKKMFFDFD